MAFVETARFTSPRGGHKEINLPKDGPAQSVWAWSEVSHHAEGDEAKAEVHRKIIRARVAAAPAHIRDAYAPYLEMALAHPIPTDPGQAYEGADLQWALVEAVYARCRELVPRPGVTGRDTDTHCRHGRPFAGECAECDTDF